MINSLRALAGNRDFGQNLEERLRDQLVIGVNNSIWRQEIFRQYPSNDVPLENILKSLQSYEQAEVQTERLE